MVAKDPLEKMGQVRWYKSFLSKISCNSLVGLDPSLGTGGDFSAISHMKCPYEASC